MREIDMAGLKLLTNLDASTCVKAAWRAAQDLGFTLPPLEDCTRRFTASKGSALLGVIAGPLAPQCVFQITVETYHDATEVALERNTPWLTSGAIGVAKVQRQAEELMSAIACGIEKAGGAVRERKEF
jgi:hypothetical protein